MKLEVIHWKRFAGLLQDVVKDQGTQDATAKVLDISKGHLSKMLNSEYTSESVDSQMLVRIEKALRAHKRWSRKKKVRAVERLWSAIMSREADRIFWNDYHVWLECDAWPFDERLAARCDRLFRQLAQEYPVLGRLDLHYSERGMDQHRITLAKHRVMEPLLASDATGGVELSVKELRKAETLGVYLRCGVRREEVLLARKPDQVRAQTIAARKPKKLRRWADERA